MMAWKVEVENAAARPHKYAELSSQKASSYDVKAIATFTSDQELSASPKIRIKSNTNTVCVAINKNCFVFDGSLQNVEHSFNFDTCITCVAISVDGNFVLIGSNDGEISLIYRPQNKCIFTRPLTTADGDTDLSICSAVFSPINTSTGISEIMIATKSGLLFHLGNINLILFQSYLENSDEKNIFQVLSQIDQSEININCTDIKCLQIGGRNTFLLCGDGISLVVKETKRDVEILQCIDKDSFLGATIIKSIVFNKCHYALLLDDEKTLHLVCLRSLIVTETFNQMSIEDFTLFENMDSLCIYEVKIVVLTIFNESYNLQLCSLPSLEVLFSLPVSPSANLIDMENLYFVENEGEQLTTSSVTIYNVNEASYQARLLRLIAMRNFDEAVVFAKTYDLDVELVFKSKLASVLEQFYEIDDQQLDSYIKDFKFSLYECFDQITDLNAVVDYCMNISMPSFSATKEILHYAKSKINNNFEFNSQKVDKLFDHLKRLETFRALYDEHQGVRGFRTTWERFRFVILWDELISYLRNGKISSVFVIWVRHCEELVSRISAIDDLNYLLETIPEISTNVSLQEWIRQSLLPVILLKSRGSINTVASWVIYRCHLMEFNDSSNWPANAISFAEMLIDVCKKLSMIDSLEALNFSLDLAMLMSQEINSQDAVLRQIRVLLDTLRDLHQLKHQFNCKISMVNYSQDDKRFVVYYLFDGIYLLENIPKFIEVFLTPFARHNSLNLDKVLAQYIKDVLDCAEIDWRYWEEAPWEKQVITILSCMQSDEDRYETLCQVLKVAPVPWSPGIQKLVENSLKSNHSLVQHIKNEKANELRRVIMRKYGFCQSDNLDSHTGNILVCHILISNIDDEALSDALAIAESIQKDSIDVYLFRMRHLIKIGQISALYHWLESISTAISIPCCKKLAMIVNGLLSDINMRDEILCEMLNFNSAAIYCLQFLQKKVNTFEFEDYQELLNSLLKLQALQEFEVFVPLNLLNSSKHTLAIFYECVKNLLAKEQTVFKTLTKIPSQYKSERKSGKLNWSLRDLFCVAKILNISKMQAVESIVKEAVNANAYSSAIECLTILCEDYFSQCRVAEIIKLFFHVLESLCCDRKFENFNACLQCIEKLKIALTKASFTCDPGDIRLVAWVMQWIYLIQHLFHISNFGTDMGSFNNWTFTSMFQETAIYLDKNKVLSLLSAIIKHVQQVDVQNLFSVDEILLVSLNTLVSYLHSRGRILLALYLHGVALTGACSAAIANSQYESILTTSIQNLNSLVSSLLKSLFIQKKLDYFLTLGAILSLPKSTSISYLQLTENKCGCDYRKLLIVATVSIEAHRRWHMYDKLPHYERLIMEAQWGKKFTRLHISYKDYFKKPASEKMKLIPIMAVDRRISLKFIEDFAVAFGLNIDDVFQTLLQVLLLSTYDDRESQNKRSAKEAIALCSLIAERISHANIDLLMETFDLVYPKMNPYNYEAIEFIMNSTINCTGKVESALKSLELLAFLHSYERKSKPCDFEIPLYFESNAEVYNYNLKRLPYHYLLEPTKASKIIVNELTPDTLTSWMKVSHILSFKQNDMIMITIESIVKQVIPSLGASNSSSTNMQWMENVNIKKKFLNMQNLLKCIDDLEKATVCLISTLKRLPPGIWKELCVQLAIRFTEKWWDSSRNEKAENTLMILKTMHRNLFIEKLFYDLQFDAKSSATFNSLKELPVELISCILEHESIIKSYWFNSERYPDIFGACRKLAHFYNVKFEKLCMTLVCKWLMPSEGASNGNLDETITMDFNFGQVNSSVVDKYAARDNQKKAIYLLRHLNSEDCIEYIVAMLRSSISSVSQADRLNYLSCLLHTQNVDSLQLLIGLDVDELRMTAKQFYFGMQLESLNLSCLMEDLTESSVVKNLIGHLIQNCSHLSSAASFAAELCLDSKIFDVTLWDSILKNMIALKLINPLISVLTNLSVCPAIVSSSMYLQAWKVVLMSNEDKDERFGLGITILMQQCPVLEELNLVSLANFYSEASRPLVVVECYLRLRNTDGYDHIKNYVRGAVAVDIINQITSIVKQVGNMYRINEIKNLVVLAMTSNATLASLWQGSYKQWIQENVFKDDQLNKILLYAAQLQKWNECSELIRYSENGDFTKTKHSDDDAKQLVKKYAEQHDLEVLLKLVTFNDPLK